MRPDYYRSTAPQLTRKVSRSLLMSLGTIFEQRLDQGGSTEGRVRDKEDLRARREDRGEEKRLEREKMDTDWNEEMLGP